MGKPLLRAADLLDQWAKDVAYAALVNEADDDPGVRLYASTLRVLASTANLRALEYKREHQFAEAAGSLPEGDE